MSDPAELTTESVAEYLDNAIRHWREKKDTSKKGDERLIARCYVDAFQSVRVSLLGDILPPGA